MIIEKIKNNKNGFVILFAVTISSIIFAIALGVANIALKEVKFGTNARDANDAFFAADTGSERALFLEKVAPGICTAPCNSSFVMYQLGSTGQGCVKVTVTKTSSSTQIVSKGYNDGGPSCAQGSNSVERELKVTY